MLPTGHLARARLPHEQSCEEQRCHDQGDNWQQHHMLISYFTSILLQLETFNEL